MASFGPGMLRRTSFAAGLLDELLVPLDGVELLDPFQLADLQNVFSTIDDHTVDAVDVYTGGSRRDTATVLELDPETGERLELIEIETP